MYLKTLTLRGFKSFASATTMTFEPGITCVVGPNGSGKSNVVDALSWVMGEQGVKSLRGGRMEDVIFAGTAERPPLGRAEVSLTIDNTDGALPVDYTEVTISRTMFRTGGSEYAINGHAARLLDVQELLSDSGMGREMHVIVGQGQLDTVLAATPDVRRGLIEEAAGVLKHRRRKEKALRKLESTQANLDRLQDLVAELRRQLKPLGRQAEVARRAATVQADLRDAAARLLADDLTQATRSLESDLADDRALAEAREAAEQELAAAREVEEQAEAALAQATPQVEGARELWYQLSTLGERTSSLLTLAGERLQQARTHRNEGRPGPDPDDLDRQAGEAADQEQELRAGVADLQAALDAASRRREDAEHAYAEADAAYAAALRAAADRREGLARLAGKLSAAQSRLDAADAEAERASAGRTEAALRGAAAQQEFCRLEAGMAGLDAGESSLDDSHERAQAEVERLEKTAKELDRREQVASERRASLTARREALAVGLRPPDGSAALLAHGAPGDFLGALSDLVEVAPGWEKAVAAGLGDLVDSLVARDAGVADAALQHIHDDDPGRVSLLVENDSSDARSRSVTLPDGFSWLADLVTCGSGLQTALAHALDGVVAVDDLAAARRLIQACGDGVTAATRDGQLLASWRAAGGGEGGSSSLEIRTAIDRADAELAEVEHDLERLRFDRAATADEVKEARRAAAAALERLHESDADLAAVTDQLGALAQQVRTARDEQSRLEAALTELAARRQSDVELVRDLRERLAAAQVETAEEPDPQERDRLADLARVARQAELDARLALRAAEEQVRSAQGRAQALRRAAVAERQARARAASEAERRRQEANRAQAVQEAALWVRAQLARSLAEADAARAEAESSRQVLGERVNASRTAARVSAQKVQDLVEGSHRDELARIQQRMRIDQLRQRSLDELGVDPDALMTEYGPDVLVPVTGTSDPASSDAASSDTASSDAEQPAPVPYVRAEQERRLRAAKRDLQVLGRVNPLAMEEFDALQERHRFLGEQLEDLRRTRKDLLDIVEEVDKRVEEVFAGAYADVEKAFAHVFSRLFPGGEGRLVLTEPGEWLTTGVDVEARPAGKKVKRLSLLSGGERSLVAVAFLVSLFIARPSPFYILDEVEAALDDMNLGRLLDIYEELRQHSQLLIITHQKRTMEIADALYGVTMRGDGVSTVVSQRLREG